jgi:uncharacterized membrane protein
MNNNINWNRLIRRLSTFLLLLTFFMQIIAVIFIDADFREFEMEEFHPIIGFAFVGAILIHLVIIRKSLKSILISKTRQS